MNRYSVKRWYYCFIPAISRTLSGSDKHIYDRLEEYNPEPQTGFERVKAIFKPTKDGIMSKEYYSIVQLSLGSFMTGMLIGGFRGGQKAHTHFLMEHRTSKFITAYEARRMLFDNTMLGAIKDGVKWGSKVGAFTLVYTGTMVIIAAYRGFDGFLEHPVSGALAGALARAYLGYKAALVGALLGTTLSSLVGILWFGMTMLGTSPSEARQMHYDFMLWRHEKILEAKKEERKMGEDKTDLHDAYLKNIDSRGYLPDDEDKVFVITKEPPKEKRTGIDALPALPDEKLS